MYAVMFHAAKPQEAYFLFETEIHMVRSCSFAEEAMTKRARIKLMVVAFLARRLILLNLLSSHSATFLLPPRSQYHDDFAIQIACVVNERLIDPSPTSPVQLLFLWGTCLIIRLHIALKLS